MVQLTAMIQKVEMSCVEIKKQANCESCLKYRGMNVLELNSSSLAVIENVRSVTDIC